MFRISRISRTLSNKNGTNGTPDRWPYFYLLTWQLFSVQYFRLHLLPCRPDRGHCFDFTMLVDNKRVVIVGHMSIFQRCNSDGEYGLVTTGELGNDAEDATAPKVKCRTCTARRLARASFNALASEASISCKTLSNAVARRIEEL